MRHFAILLTFAVPTSTLASCTAKQGSTPTPGQQPPAIARQLQPAASKQAGGEVAYVVKIANLPVLGLTLPAGASSPLKKSS